MHLTRVFCFLYFCACACVNAEVTTAASMVLYFNSVYQAAYLSMGHNLKPLIAPAPRDRRAPRQIRPDPRLDAKTLLLRYMLPSGSHQMERTRRQLQTFIEANPRLDAALRSYDPEPQLIEAGFQGLYWGLNRQERPRAIWDARVSVPNLFPFLNPRVGFLPLIREAERVMRLSVRKNASGTAHYQSVANAALQEMQRQRTLANGEASILDLRRLQSGQIRGVPAMKHLNLSTKIFRSGNVFQEAMDIRGTLALSQGLTSAEKGYLRQFLIGRDASELVSMHAKIIEELDYILSEKEVQPPSQIQGACQL